MEVWQLPSLSLGNLGLNVDLTLVNEIPKCKDVWDDILKLFYAIHNLLSAPMEKKIFYTAENTCLP